MALEETLTESRPAVPFLICSTSDCTNHDFQARQTPLHQELSLRVTNAWSCSWTQVLLPEAWLSLARKVTHTGRTGPHRPSQSYLCFSGTKNLGTQVSFLHSPLHPTVHATPQGNLGNWNWPCFMSVTGPWELANKFQKLLAVVLSEEKARELQRQVWPKSQAFTSE